MARYDENFRKLAEYVAEALESGEEHWFPSKTAPASITNPTRGAKPRRVFICEAVYAATRGAIPPGQRAIAKCGESWCVRPEHLGLTYSGKPNGVADCRAKLQSFSNEFPILAKFEAQTPVSAK
jgi:hypothetical protein